MPRYFLQRLSIEGFRGIHNEGSPLEFKFDHDAVNSVFAPNGGGKSSAYEAIVYAIKGKLPKLDSLQDADNPEGYFVNKFHSKGTATIELGLTPDDGSNDVTLTVVRSLDGKRSVSGTGCVDPEALLLQLASDLTCLDYTDFQKFIADTPLARGRSFASLLGLSQLSEHRQALETLANSANLKRDFSLDILAERLSALNQKLQEYRSVIAESFKGLSGSQLPMNWTEASVCADAVNVLRGEPTFANTLDDSCHFDNVDCDALDKTVKKAENNELRSDLASLISSITTLRSFASKGINDEATETESLQSKICSRTAALEKTEGSLKKALYDSALAVVCAEGWTNPFECPVCRTNLDVQLKPFLQQLLAHYSEVELGSEAIAKAWALSSWPKRMEDIETNSIMKVDENDRLMSRLSPKFRSGTASLDDLNALTERLRQLDILRESAIASLEAKSNILQQSLPPSLVDLTKKVAHARQLKEALKGHSGDLASSKRIRARLKIRNEWSEFIQAASKCFSIAESIFSKEKTASLEASYVDLFKRIMSNDYIIPQARREAGKEKLHLRLDNFYGLYDLTATALLSESYRNALAISIYLSAACQNLGTARFIILDDVTSSFDAGHQWALMDVLRNQIARPNKPDGPQVIFFSHDGLLEKYFDRMASTSGWHHARLQGNCPIGRLYVHAQSVDRLKSDALQFVQQGNTKQAEPLVRQYMEYQLLQIIRKVAIPVPFDFAIKDSNQMVANCIDAIRSAILLHKKANSLILAPAQEQGVLNSYMPAVAGNALSHYSSAISSGVDGHVINGLFKAIDSISDCFKYDCSCSGTMKRRFYRSLSEKSCNC